MRKVILTKDNIDRLYDKLKHIDDYRDKPGYEFFVQSLYNAEVILEFDWGILRLTDLVVGDKITAHGLFWNKGILRNVEDFKIAGDYVRDTFKVKVVYVMFPSKLKSLIRLMEKSCFTMIQVVQNALYNGIIKEDGILYGYGG